MKMQGKEHTKIKVLFVIHDLSVGGAEKVLINLVNNMDASRFDVSVLALFDEGVNKQFLSPHVTYRYAFRHAIRGNSQYLKLLSPERLYAWLIPEGYDLVVSYLEGPCARIVGGAPEQGVKTVSWIHCTYRREKELAKSFRSLKEARRCYEKADRVVFVSEQAKELFLQQCPIKCQTSVLYNTNESEKILSKASEIAEDEDFGGHSFYWCGVGKIVPNKGFDRMVRIQKRLLKAGYDVKLLILGTGWQEKELKKWCQENEIAQSVHFLGYQTNPYKYVAKCDLFVCASHEEGFSTAATEALIVGTPVCTVDVSGMKEMLGAHQEYGMIVPNEEEALYQGIKKLLDQPALRNHYKEMAIRRGKAFRTEETVNAVQEMLIQVMEN